MCAIGEWKVQVPVENQLDSAQKSGQRRAESRPTPCTSLAILLLAFRPSVLFNRLAPSSSLLTKSPSAVLDTCNQFTCCPPTARHRDLLLSARPRSLPRISIKSDHGLAGSGLTAREFKSKLKALSRNASERQEAELTTKGRGKKLARTLLRMPHSNVGSAVYLSSDITPLLLTLKRERAWELSLAALWRVAEEKPEMLTRSHANIVISTLADAHPPQWESACAVLESMPSMGLGRDAYSYSSAITACARAGRTRNALAIFRQCCAETEPNQGPNVVVFNVTLQACIQGGDQWHPHILGVFASMVAHGAQPSAWQYSTVLNAYARSHQWQKALDVIREMKSRRHGPQPESHCYAAAMRACLGAGQFSNVLDLYREMVKEEMPRTAYTLVPVFNSCAQIARTGQRGMWTHAKSILKEEAAAGVLNLNCYAAAMHTYAECGRFEEAFALLTQMAKATPPVEPNIHVFTSVIASLTLSRNWQVALGLLGSIHKNGVRVDAAAVEATLKVLGRAGEWYQACELLCTMSDRFNVKPSHIHLTTVLECVAVNEKWHEAYAVLEDVIDDLIDDCVVDTRLLEIVIKVCSLAGAWQRALDILEAVGDGATMKMCHDVVAALVKAREWTLAKELFDDMRERRFAGQSLAGLRQLAKAIQQATVQ
mmetsp:Transcript_89701/g.158755  ORF Transcript_89701/g.158755 Transcript_89701/m.158755 type:complete len:655 (-) Transcript_89701:148-2112(-)